MEEREFNVTGVCVPNMHYMVDISNKMEQIKALIDKRDYFTINRARQYGKTTTLHALKNMLDDEYVIVSLTFEGLGEELEAPESFCQTFMEIVQEALAFTKASDDYINSWIDLNVKSFRQLSRHITKMCREKKLVLMIDEVDKISNNRVFLDFLSMLRKKYLARNKNEDFTFHSVILAGVYDIKNLRWKIKERSGDNTESSENKIYNSPWNIATTFEVDMSFNPEEISTMLTEYETDHQTGMNISEVARHIHFYTAGYPFLVSRICQHIHHKLDKNWSKDGIQNAIKIIVEEPSTLLEDLYNNVKSNQELSILIDQLLLRGEKIPFNLGVSEISLGVMYGYFTKTVERGLVISNKIFEMVLTEYFVVRNKLDNPDTKIPEFQEEIINDKQFNMQLALEKFFEHYPLVYNAKTAEFLEREGRLLFLTYLIPILNGKGFYYIESQTLSETRMDLVINYGGQEFILELKKWKGQARHEDAYAQLSGYLDTRSLATGYLLTFDFRQKKQPKAGWIKYEDKEIFDVIV